MHISKDMDPDVHTWILTSKMQYTFIWVIMYLTKATVRGIFTSRTSDSVSHGGKS